MAILNGSVSARLWRVTEALPAEFGSDFERSMKRHAFRPVDVEKAALRSAGWVNLRQVLDANLTMKKVLFGNLIALALRVDRLAINQRLFRATLAQEIARVLREEKTDRISREQRAGLEEQVRGKLLREQIPSTNVYEMAWHLESGLVVFGATSDKLNIEFGELFTQTFNLGVEPLFPFLRAQRWAKRQRAERELSEVLPAPFSPRAPAEVIHVAGGDEGEDG